MSQKHLMVGDLCPYLPSDLNRQDELNTGMATIRHLNKKCPSNSDINGTLKQADHLSSNSAVNKHIVFYKKSPCPKQKRTSFSIIRKEIDKISGKTSQKSIDDHELDALNMKLKDGTLTISEVTAHVSEIVHKLNLSEKKKRNGIWVANTENQKLLENYWNERYGATPKIRRPRAAKYRLQWAIKLIGQSSLLEKKQILQEIVDQCCINDKAKQRRLCSVLNEIRKWFGLPKSEQLSREQRPLTQFKYLTEEQFLRILASVEPTSNVSVETYKSLFVCLFYSGARTGEAFAFKAHHLLNQKLKIHTQVDRNGTECCTKNGKKRTAILFKEANEAFKYWCEAVDKLNIDRTALSKVWLNACKKAFPDNPYLWTRVHDLRHSYAVKCLTVHQISLDYVAKLIGDSVHTCEEYYLSFEQNESLLDHVIRAIHSV